MAKQLNHRMPLHLTGISLPHCSQLQAQVLEYFVAGVHLSMRKLLLLQWHFIGFCMNCNNEALRFESLTFLELFLLCIHTYNSNLLLVIHEMKNGLQRDMGIEQYGS